MSAKSVENYKAFEEKRQEEREAAEQNSLFREVDDDLRQDELSAFWKRYGKFVIGGALAIVIAVAGYQIYKNNRDNERIEQAKILDQSYTALRSGKKVEATELLNKLETTGNTGYRTLARLRQAALLLDEGKILEGRAQLQAVASDADAFPTYKDLATVLDSMAGLDTDRPEEIEEKLAVMTAAGHPWRHMALELTALAVAKSGRPQAAADLLKDIIDDPDTQDSQRQMANNLRTVFLRDAAEKNLANKDAALEAKTPKNTTPKDTSTKDTTK